MGKLAYAKIMIGFFTCKYYRIDCVTNDHLFIMKLFIVQRQLFKKNLNNFVNTNKKINLLRLTKSKTSIFFHRKKMQKTVTLIIFHSEQCTRQWCRTIQILRAFRDTSKELAMVQFYVYIYNSGMFFYNIRKEISNIFVTSSKTSLIK